MCCSRPTALLALVLWAAGRPAAHAQVQYTVTDIGVLPSSPTSAGAVVNNAGQVVGVY